VSSTPRRVSADPAPHPPDEMPADAADPATSDGRNRRRDRNRDAVVAALLELYREGDPAPRAEQIAARAGLSPRSLFRYFDDVEAMVRAAIERQQLHIAPLYQVDAPADLPFDERIDRFVTARLRLIEGMGEVGRVARTLAPRQPLILAELAAIRHRLRHQLAEVFAPELDALPAAERRRALASADVITSWEARDLMHNDQGLPLDEVADAMRDGLRRLLGAPAPATPEPADTRVGG
jgi:AcrR family transcriptional regulator